MRRNLIFIILFMITAAGITALAQENIVIGGDDAALRAFIARYVGAGQPVTVNIAALPDGLPFQLPLPPNVRLLGSVTRPSGTGGQFYEISMDGSTPAEVLKFYVETLGGAGWQVIQADDTTTGGFSTALNSYGRFCLSDNSASVVVNAYTSGGQPNVVAVNIQTPGEAYQCQAVTGLPPDDPYKRIPSLTVPEGVTLLNNINGLSYASPQGKSSASSPALLQSSQPLADIMVAYNSQLAGAGWTQVSAETGTTFALSVWAIPGDDGKTWKGTLMMVATDQAGVYNALIYVEAP